MHYTNIQPAACFAQSEQEEKNAQTVVRRYSRGLWARTFCTMLRYNLFACVRDTSEGIRRPRTTASAARTGPYPSWNVGNEEEGDNLALGANNGSTGTVNAPVAVNLGTTATVD